MEPNSLGRFIEQRRDQLGISLRELAKRLEMSPSFLSQIERDRQYPSISLRTKMAKFFEVDADFLKSLELRVPFSELKRLVLRNDKFRMALRDAVNGVKRGEINLDHLADKLACNVGSQQKGKKRPKPRP